MLRVLGALVDLVSINAPGSVFQWLTRQLVIATEFSVASLVAQGLTNREAAARPYISMKTVEYHLGHIYNKLNITGRRQLRDQLATARPT